MHGSHLQTGLGEPQAEPWGKRLDSVIIQGTHCSRVFSEGVPYGQRPGDPEKGFAVQSPEVHSGGLHSSQKSIHTLDNVPLSKRLIRTLDNAPLSKRLISVLSVPSWPLVFRAGGFHEHRHTPLLCSLNSPVTMGPFAGEAVHRAGQ